MAYAILGTVGLEFEAELSPRSAEIYKWTGTDDASITRPASLTNRGYTVLKTPENTEITRILSGSDIKIGKEFVSGIMEGMDTVRGAVMNLVTGLGVWGENYKNKRAGLHVHVGWAFDLITLKNTVKISAWLESLLFHLAGMGYEFRGIYNNSAYCRPITLYGPPVVPSNMGMVQLTNMQALLDSHSIEEFWGRFGGVNIHRNQNRYVPHRYMAVNMFSAFLHGTLEFRMFNTTLNPEYIVAVADLCKEITKLTNTTFSIPDEVNSVFEESDVGKSHNTLSKLLSMIHVEPRTETVLREILETTPVCVLKKHYSTSHVRSEIEFSSNFVVECRDKFPVIQKFESPGNIDIHSIENEILSADRACCEKEEKEREIWLIHLSIRTKKERSTDDDHAICSVERAIRDMERRRTGRISGTASTATTSTVSANAGRIRFGDLSTFDTPNDEHTIIANTEEDPDVEDPDVEDPDEEDFDEEDFDEEEETDLP